MQHHSHTHTHTRIHIYTHPYLAYSYILFPPLEILASPEITHATISQLLKILATNNSIKMLVPIIRGTLEQWSSRISLLAPVNCTSNWAATNEPKLMQRVLPLVTHDSFVFTKEVLSRREATFVHQ